MPLLLSIIAVLVVGGGVYIYQDKKAKAPAVTEEEIQETTQVEQQTTTQTPPVKTQTNSQTNTSNWKTYTSSKYGFRFQYPADWKNCLNIREGAPESFRNEFKNKGEIFCFISNELNPVTLTPPTISGFIRGDLFGTYDSVFSDRKNRVEETNASGFGGGSAWIKEKTLDSKDTFDYCFGDAGWSCQKYFKLGDNWFVISYTDTDTGAKMITDSIFSTFKFTK